MCVGGGGGGGGEPGKIGLLYNYTMSVYIGVDKAEML